MFAKSIKETRPNFMIFAAISCLNFSKVIVFFSKDGAEKVEVNNDSKLMEFLDRLFR